MVITCYNYAYQPLTKKLSAKFYANLSAKL